MAYTDITSSLCSNGSWSSGGYSVSLTNPSTYKFVASAITGSEYPSGIAGTTSLSSNNAGKATSSSLCYLSCTPSSSNGMRLKISYVSCAETTWDYAIFGNSGVTLTTGSVYNTTGVLAHTRGSQNMNLRTVDYFLTASTNIYISYRKDGSGDRGIDRLVFRVSVEPAGGDGGGNWTWLGCAVRLYGYRWNASQSYSLANFANSTIFDISQGSGALEVADGSGCTAYDSDTFIFWFSGSSASIIERVEYTPGQTDEYYSEFYPPGHTSDENEVYWLAVTGTSAQSRPNPTTVFSLNGVSISNIVKNIYCDQNKYTVYVKTRSGSNGLPKAYYSIGFPSPINTAFPTGKQGYVTVMSSANTNSMSVSITRDGSNTIQQTVNAWQDLTVYPESSSTKIMTTADLWLFNSALGHDYSSTDYLCVKYDSNIHDSYVGATNKLMNPHDFLYFTGTPNYFKDDVADASGGGSGTVGHTVQCNSSLVMTCTNNTNITNTLYSFGITCLGYDSVQIVHFSGTKRLSANNTGTVNLNIDNGGTSLNVTALTVNASLRYNAQIEVTLECQSDMSYTFLMSDGVESATVNLYDDITITGVTMTISIST